MTTRSKAAKAEPRHAMAHKMSPDLQRKIARIASELQVTLINLRVQADKAKESCGAEGDLESGSPVYIVQLLAREAERQVDSIQSLAGDY